MLRMTPIEALGSCSQAPLTRRTTVLTEEVATSVRSIPEA